MAPCPELQRAAAEYSTARPPVVKTIDQLAWADHIKLHVFKVDLYSPTRGYADWSVQRPYTITLDVMQDGESVLHKYHRYFRLIKGDPDPTPEQFAREARDAVQDIFRAALEECNTRRAPPCSVLIHAAGDCGVGDVLCGMGDYDRANYCHMLALSFDKIPLDLIGAQMTDLRDCVSADKMRALLAQRDSRDCTPYERAFASRGAEFAEMFRPPMPKSAATQ